jgi:hypothetical protein
MLTSVLGVSRTITARQDNRYPTLPGPWHTPKLLELIPDSAWTPAYDAHDEVRDGAWVRS